MEDQMKNKLLTNKKYIILLAICLIVIVLITMFLILYRSPKAAVEQFVKSYNDRNGKKIVSLLDIKGVAAYSNMEEDVENSFSDTLKEMQELSKNEEEDKKYIEEAYNNVDNKIENKIIKIEKDEKNKELTNIFCEFKFDDSEITRDVTFTVYQKGLKSYIINVTGML